MTRRGAEDGSAWPLGAFVFLYDDTRTDLDCYFTVRPHGETVRFAVDDDALLPRRTSSSFQAGARARPDLGSDAEHFDLGLTRRVACNLTPQTPPTPHIANLRRPPHHNTCRTLSLSLHLLYAPPTISALPSPLPSPPPRRVRTSSFTMSARGRLTKAASFSRGSAPIDRGSPKATASSPKERAAPRT